MTDYDSDGGFGGGGGGVVGGGGLRGGLSAMQKLRTMRQNKMFRRIEGEVKEKEKKRRSNRTAGYQESYVDRDRLIAVTMGESDIRETMIKHREFLAEKNPEMHYEDEQNFRILVQQGEHELKKGAFHTALSYLDKAVKTIPHDIESRLLRGTCLAGVQEYDRALLDIDEVLDVKVDCSRALHVKADTLYQLGDFEHALVFYYRALTCVSSTKEENRLRFGIGRAERAIDNALGAATANGHFAHMDQIIIDKVPFEIFEMTWDEIRDLDEDWDISKRKGTRARKVRRSCWSTNASTTPGNPNNSVASKQNEQQQQQQHPPPSSRRASGSKRKSGSIYKTKFLHDDSKQDKKPKTKRERAYQRRLLGNLNKDLDYLQTLASEMKVGSARVSDDDREGMLLAREAEDAVTFLCKRQEFWRQYKPMYSEEKGAGGRRRRAVRRVRA